MHYFLRQFSAYLNSRVNVKNKFFTKFESLSVGFSEFLTKINLHWNFMENIW